MNENHKWRQRARKVMQKNRTKNEEAKKAANGNTRGVS